MLRALRPSSGRCVARLPRVGVAVWAVLVALVGQFGSYVHVHGGGHVGHDLGVAHAGHDHHGHEHAHHDHDHDHDLPDGPTWSNPAHDHGCVCPVQVVPVTVQADAMPALARGLAPDAPKPLVLDEHLVAHRAEPLRALAPKTSPPRG